MTIAVTGAHGFIGAAVFAALRAGGRPARALVRRQASAPRDDFVAIGDLVNDLDLRPALQGVSVMIHCAGLAHQVPGAASEAAIHAINVVATERLARAAAAAGVSRFVYMSSAKVMGERSGARPFKESDDPAPADAYARSKLAAEASLSEVASATGMDIVILRPPLVYGPGVRANFLRLLAACDSPWPLPLGSARAPRSLVSINNLVDAALRCADSRLHGVHRFFVADAHAPGVADLVAHLRRLLDRPQRMPSIPLPLLRGAARCIGREPDLDRLTLPMQVDTSALHAAIGWAPVQTPEQGLAATVAWWRAIGRGARRR